MTLPSFCAKGDRAVGDVHEPAVRNGDAVRVATEVAENARPRGRLLRVDNPVLRRCAHEASILGSSKSSNRAKVPRQAPSAAIILARKTSRIVDRKRYCLSGSPFRALSGEASSGDESVHVGVELQLARPGVQNRRDADGGLQPRLPESNQRFARRSAESVENVARIRFGEPPELARESEHDVEVRHGEQPLRARTNPPLLLQGLTLWAVPVATGVVRGMFVSAAGAHVDMTAQCGRTTKVHGRKHPR
jgi:hypothetical protein